MPKGGLLHAHLDATVNVSCLLKLALKYPAIHVRASKVLDSTTISSVLPEMAPLSQELRTKGEITLTDKNYTPNTWVPITKAREKFDSSLGGPAGFDQWITAALTISPEAYATYDTVTKVCIPVFLRCRS